MTLRTLLSQIGLEKVTLLNRIAQDNLFLLVFQGISQIDI